MNRDGQSHRGPAAPAMMGQGVEGPQAGMTVGGPHNNHYGGRRDGGTGLTCHRKEANLALMVG